MAFRDRIKRFDRVAAADLKANPKNWRTHPPEQREALRGVLAEVGFADAVLAREDADGGLVLIDGHLRLDECQGETLPVLVLDVTEPEADKLLATLDPLAAMAEADAAKLDALLREVQTGSEALASMLTDLAEEAGTLSSKGKEIVEDEAPEPPPVPVTKPGDLWLLGEHRVLCGDSTKADGVARLMGGAKADLCFTSPPYNVAAKSSLKNKDKYQGGGDCVSSLEYLEFLNAFMAIAVDVSCFVWVNVQSVAGNKLALIEFLHQHRNRYADTVIWDKLAAEPAMARMVLNSRFEYVHGFSEKATRAVGARDFRGTVENLLPLRSRQDKQYSDIHRATYPVAFAAWFIGNFANEGAAVYDPFLGSGTTLIAAEQLGRKCYGLEISPQYCDVIVKRWEALTGKTAVLSSE